jgi:hypothetical protein
VERHPILSEEGNAFRAQPLALKLLQPERAPTNGQSPLAIDHAMPGNVRRAHGERPSHHAW